MKIEANPELARRLIGAKREEKVADLKERIRKVSISVLEDISERDFTCYFCNTNIEGRVWVLIDEELVNGKESVTRYSTCDNCYHSSKHFVYYRGVPFSLN